MKKEYLLVTLSILCWGMIATISKYFFSGLSPYYILATTSLVALLVLLLWNGKTFLQQIKKTSLFTAICMIAVGCLGIVFYNIFLQLGIARMPAQKAFVINYLWPSFIILFSAPILKEKLTARKLLAIFVSFFGVAVIATNGQLSSLLTGREGGELYCVLAAICYGLYTPLNKRQTYDKDMALILTYAFATLVAGTVCIFEHSLVVPSGFQLTGMVLFGVFSNALAYIFWVHAMDMGDTAMLSNLVYFTPVVSLFATHVVLYEDITIFSILGLALIFLGVIIQMRGQGKKQFMIQQ